MEKRIIMLEKSNQLEEDLKLCYQQRRDVRDVAKEIDTMDMANV